MSERARHFLAELILARGHWLLVPEPHPARLTAELRDAGVDIRSRYRNSWFPLEAAFPVLGVWSP